LGVSGRGLKGASRGLSLLRTLGPPNVAILAILGPFGWWCCYLTRDWDPEDPRGSCLHTCDRRSMPHPGELASGPDPLLSPPVEVGDPSRTAVGPGGLQAGRTSLETHRGSGVTCLETSRIPRSRDGLPRRGRRARPNRWRKPPPRARGPGGPRAYPVEPRGLDSAHRARHQGWRAYPERRSLFQG
jgi:hypothetical protein